MNMQKKTSSASKCADCGKETREVASQEWVINYRWNNPDWKPNDTIKEYLCLECGDKVYKIRITDEAEKAKKYKKQREEDAKETANDCFAKLRELNEELGNKVKNEDLNVADYKKFRNLKNKISKLTKEKGIENWEIYLTAEMDFKLLKKSIESLEKTVKDNASPQTIDRANGKGKRECSHNKDIEPCTDDPTFFCCSYCWDTESPEFLKKLKRWHVSNFDKILRDNGVEFIEFVKSSNYDNYEKLSKSTPNNQAELKSLYQTVEQDLQTYLKDKKGIIITTSRERERANSEPTAEITHWNYEFRSQSY